MGTLSASLIVCLINCWSNGEKMDFMLVSYFCRTVSGMTGKHFSVRLCFLKGDKEFKQHVIWLATFPAHIHT